MTCTNSKAPTPHCRSAFQCPAIVLLQGRYMALPVLSPSVEGVWAVHHQTQHPYS